MKKRRKRGTGFIEAVCAAMILIPLALCLLDLITLAIANSIHDTALKNATRAAANQPDGTSAQQAADKSLESVRQSGIIKSITIDTVDYAPGQDVAIQTTMKVKLPVPFPGLSNLTFKAAAVEPIVAMKDSP